MKSIFPLKSISGYKMKNLLVSEKTVKRTKFKLNKKKKFAKVNYFDRIKSLHGGQFKNIPQRNNFYFDCETFEYYEDKHNPDEIPIIIPYLIGVCTDEPGSYKHYIGLNSTIQFFDDLISHPNVKLSNLCAFNLDYDFHSIRPFIVEKYHKEIRIFYEMTDNKKFIFGQIKNREKAINGNKAIDIKFLDLWRWDTQHSLKSYIKHIIDLIYDSEGNVKNDEIGLKLNENLIAWGFNKDSFKKLEIDVKKVNLHQVGDKWYYYPSKQDWINDTNKRELPLEHELKYLEIDVTSLPSVYLEQCLMRQLAIRELGITTPIDPDRAITAPGFAKWLCEEYEKKYMTETYRRKVSKEKYDLMLWSYTGAFVGGNKNITYLDEKVFANMFPNQSFFDAENKPKIKSYDVNSMYPWAMNEGLPYGQIYNSKPAGKCVTWCEIHFKSYIDPETKTIYKWKKKYEYLNNSFFGDRFIEGIVPGSHSANKAFILKELYELFISMCDVDCEVVAERYQKISYALKPFVDGLYKIKRNDAKKYPDSTVKLVKLMLNSLYGKMAEKYKKEKVQWAIDCDTFIYNHPELLEELKVLGVTTITEEIKNTHKFKLRVSPFVDLTNDCGFFFVENTDKRYDAQGNDCRESITAGIYITALSRWKLLSTVKGEIDQGNIILYCDTDSIKLIELKKPKFETHDKDLGAWKYEGSFYYFGHANKLKKYFMYNPYEKNLKKKWMVKTSGINEKYLKNTEGEFDLDMIRTIYDPNNRVLVKNAKPSNKRNHWFQVVIEQSDFKFIFESPKDEITHILDKGVLTHV